MIKYIDADLLREKIESIGLYAQKSADYNDGRNDMKMMVLDIIDSLQQEQLGVDLENYITNKLRELSDDLINNKLFAYTRGLNVGRANAYKDILNRLKARKEE